MQGMQHMHGVFVQKTFMKILKRLDKRGVRIPVPKNQDKCTQCNLCALMCPDQAVKVDEKDE